MATATVDQFNFLVDQVREELQTTKTNVVDTITNQINEKVKELDTKDNMLHSLVVAVSQSRQPNEARFQNLEEQLANSMNVLRAECTAGLA